MLSLWQLTYSVSANSPGPGEHALVNGFNTHMLSLFAAQPSPAGANG